MNSHGVDILFPVSIKVLSTHSLFSTLVVGICDLLSCLFFESQTPSLRSRFLSFLHAHLCGQLYNQDIVLASR